MTKLTPKVDLVFKKLFGVEENKDLLISLINSIVSIKDQIADVTILNPYTSQSTIREKMSILDIKARGENGKQYNIEMQISNESDYDKRALLYWSKLYAEQLETGNSYSKLSKTIGIHILNFSSTVENDKYHNVFVAREEETGERYFENFEIHTIELKKFTNNVKGELSEIAKKIKSSLDMWVTFLTRHNLLKTDKLPEPFNNKKLKKALDILEVMNFSKEEHDAYEARLKWLMIEESTLKQIRREGIEQGIEQGREEGIEQGIEQGREEGIEQGREEGIEQRNLEIARNLLSQGMDQDTISSVTGLSINQIKSLQDK